MIRLKNLLLENNLETTIQKIDKLPKGKIFDDAKNLEGVFKKSKYTWSEVIENFEKNQQDAELQSINLKNIHITQPNIQSSKVSKMIGDISNLDNINAVQFPDGEIAIYDGHHRLAAHWAIGDTSIKVNLVKLENAINEGFVLQNLESKYNIKLSLYNNGKFLLLHRIVIPKEMRGQGLGTKVMNDIIRYADNENKAIYLTPSKSLGASSLSRLERFYKQFGFVKKNRSDFSTTEKMVRFPKK